MFNLEQSIAEWRRQMLAAGVKNPNVLDELEIHLREDVEKQMREGSGAQQASKRPPDKSATPMCCKRSFQGRGLF